jgi:thiol-disulfide isomerase/thioredoxin
MNFIYKIFSFIRPVLPVILMVTVLYVTGQLGNVASYGQSAVLKIGVLNAGTETETEAEEEDFDFNFSAFTVDGKPLTMDSLKNKVIFLNIWATWCGPCRAEMPTIQSLYNTVKSKDMVFVMLSIDRADPIRKVREYITKSDYTFPVYILKGQPTEQLRVPTIPTTFIISKKGKVIRKEVGMKNYDTEKFRKFLQAEAE